MWPRWLCLWVVDHAWNLHDLPSDSIELCRAFTSVRYYWLCDFITFLWFRRFEYVYSGYRIPCLWFSRKLKNWMRAYSLHRNNPSTDVSKLKRWERDYQVEVMETQCFLSCHIFWDRLHSKSKPHFLRFNENFSLRRWRDFICLTNTLSLWSSTGTSPFLPPHFPWPQS